MAKGKTKLALSASLPVAPGLIERRIYVIRGQKVMLDSDLAELYQVTTGNLNLAVRRNLNRFPPDFMFLLNKHEAKSLLLQIAIAKTGRGGRQTPPYVFTEQGVAMLSSVLKSERAVQVNIAIMRAFVRLRQILSARKDIVAEINKLKKEQQYQRGDIKRIFKIIEALLMPRKPKPLPAPPIGPIGFRT